MRMPVNPDTYAKDPVKSMFQPLVTYLSVEGVEIFISATMEAPTWGVDAI